MNGWLVVAMTAIGVSVWCALPAASLRRIHRKPVAAAVGTSPTGSLRWAVSGGVVTLVVGWLLLPGGWLWALPVLLVPGAIAGERLGRRVPSAAQRRHDRRRAEDLPAALDLLATCLAAGLPLRAAAAAVRDITDGPVHDDLAGVLRRLDLGVPDREAWLQLAETSRWRGVARDLARSVASGTGLVDTLHQAAEEARQAQHADELERARTVGVRSVWPLMLCYLPAFMLLGIVPIVGSAVLRLLG
ncbi:type II secretion system F family protein [Enemella sp. A6]|uniref:type II secretion system F family protein n=1 Tax=Enemella sp. A6 TaxID=3440152 RepID=UPI003EB8C1F4